MVSRVRTCKIRNEQSPIWTDSVGSSTRFGGSAASTSRESLFTEDSVRQSKYLLLRRFLRLLLSLLLPLTSTGSSCWCMQWTSLSQQLSEWKLSLLLPSLSLLLVILSYSMQSCNLQCVYDVMYSRNICTVNYPHIVVEVAAVKHATASSFTSLLNDNDCTSGGLF